MNTADRQAWPLIDSADRALYLALTRKGERKRGEDQRNALTWYIAAGKIVGISRTLARLIDARLSAFYAGELPPQPAALHDAAWQAWKYRRNQANDRRRYDAAQEQAAKEAPHLIAEARQACRDAYRQKRALFDALNEFKAEVKSVKWREGEAERMELMRRNVERARQLMQRGLPLADIRDATGLTNERLLQIAGEVFAHVPKNATRH